MASTPPALRILVIIFLVAQFTDGVHGLYCFQCLAIDCKPEDAECQQLQTFVQQELKQYYHIQGNLTPCPNISDTYEWRQLQVNDEECPEEEKGTPTCTLGRMKLRITDNAGNQTAPVRYAHASVLGCAKPKLVNRIATAFTKRGRCDHVKFNKTSAGTSIHLDMVHCENPKMECSKADYCIHWMDSKIKPLGTPQVGVRDNLLLIATTIGGIAMVVLGVMLITCAKLSHLPDYVENHKQIEAIIAKGSMSNLLEDAESVDGDDKKDDELNDENASLPPSPCTPVKFFIGVDALIME